MDSTAAIIHGARRVSIHDGTFIIYNQRTASGIVNLDYIQALPQGIKTLIDSGRVSWSSLYHSDIRMKEANAMAVKNGVVGWRSLLEYKSTSGSNFDHSGVDDAINAIFEWVTDSAQPLIMWMHDDNRTKTSFVAQVVAYLLAEHCRLSATFFFDGHTDRHSLVPTLVHEFTRQHDDLLVEISRAIERNPGIFNFNHQVQLSTLLIGPLKVVSESYQADPQHQPQDDIILLHAFEDCSEEGGFQESLLDALLETLISIKSLKYPQRLLIIGKRTDLLEEFLTGKLASRSPILQRPVQSQHCLSRDQDIRRKTMELKRREDEIRQSFLAFQDTEEKMRRYKEECERIRTLCSRKEQEITEREKLVQGRENRLREREESAAQMAKELNKEKLRIQQHERALRSREKDIKTREEEHSRVSSEQATGSGDTRSIVSSSPTSPVLQLPLVNSPIQEPGVQEDARMISPASQVARTDRVIILMGPLVPQKSDFIDCLTRCVNPWRFYPSTKTSNQFFDSHSQGKGRFWVKAVRTQRQSHSVLFVDFPSLGDDDLAAAHILENIGTWLTEIHQNEVTKIAGILYFHPLLEAERGPSHRNLRALGQICGHQAAEKVIFVFQELSSPVSQKAEDFFQQQYGNLMKGFGARFDHFDNTAASGWRIVDRLLGPQSRDVSLLLQDELLVLKRSLHETYAAKQLYGDLVARLRKSSSDPTNDDGYKFRAELERIQLLQRRRQSNAREPELSATGVNFPDLIYS